LTFATALNAAQLTPDAAKTQPAQFSLEIRLSQETIRGDEEIPLEVIMTNTSSQSLEYGVVYGPPLWTRFCSLDVHDAGGKVLEQKPAMLRFLARDSGGPTLFLAPAEKVRVEMLLNRIYDLSKPGKYTVRALRYDDNRSLVKSSILTLIIPPGDSSSGRRVPAFSLTVSSSGANTKVGYQVPVKIKVRNISKERIAFRTWEEDTKVGAGLSHEFASGIDVRDALGNPVRRTELARRLDSQTTFPDGHFAFVSLNAGEAFEQTRIVGQFYDSTRPGEYELQVRFFDPQNNLAVKSNPLTLNVLGQDSEIQPRQQSPFLLDIRAVENPARQGLRFKAGVYLAVTDLSDHSIEFDVAYGDSDVDVFDKAGNLAPLTDNGKLYRGPLPRGSGPPIAHLNPGETASGGMIDLDSLYDLSRPGQYIVQVIAFDPETKTTVKSNQITLIVTR
jgi:hypothetical protein